MLAVDEAICSFRLSRYSIYLHVFRQTPIEIWLVGPTLKALARGMFWVARMGKLTDSAFLTIFDREAYCHNIRTFFKTGRKLRLRFEHRGPITAARRGSIQLVRYGRGA